MNKKTTAKEMDSEDFEVDFYENGHEQEIKYLVQL